MQGQIPSKWGVYCQLLIYVPLKNYIDINRNYYIYVWKKIEIYNIDRYKAVGEYLEIKSWLYLSNYGQFTLFQICTPNLCFKSVQKPVPYFVQLSQYEVVNFRQIFEIKVFRNLRF